jgi:hypothetical protein
MGQICSSPIAAEIRHSAQSHSAAGGISYF